MSDEVQQRLAAARESQKAGRAADAAEQYRAILRLAPDHPVALNALGVQALARNDAVAGEALFARATAADAAAPDLWMNLAKARRMRGDDAGEKAALDGALRCDQRYFMALVRLAELHERRGEGGPAMERWTHVLAASSAMEPRPSQLDALFTHAQDYVARMRGMVSNAIDDGLVAARTAVPAAERRRFDACVEHAFGRRPVYRNECAGTYFPFLPAEEFFPRDHFPWAAGLEAHTAEIRAELQALLADAAAGIAPYVAMDPGTPQNKWSPLNNSLAWGALHLWRHGHRIDEACARAPRTAEILSTLPMADMPGRTPTAFFSILKPRTHLPAHTGVSNTRTIVHLPLIVPPGCRFRVGGETRAWREGECLFFDDTIEHEAWNDSDQLRAVLIFDVWNPHLTEAERGLLRTFYRASDKSGYGARAQVSD